MLVNQRTHTSLRYKPPSPLDPQAPDCLSHTESLRGHWQHCRHLVWSGGQVRPCPGQSNNQHGSFLVALSLQHIMHLALSGGQLRVGPGQSKRPHSSGGRDRSTPSSEPAMRHSGDDGGQSVTPTGDLHTDERDLHTDDRPGSLTSQQHAPVPARRVGAGVAHVLPAVAGARHTQRHLR